MERSPYRKAQTPRAERTVQSGEKVRLADSPDEKTREQELANARALAELRVQVIKERHENERSIRRGGHLLQLLFDLLPWLWR